MLTTFAIHIFPESILVQRETIKRNNFLAVWHYATTASRCEWINAVENTEGLPQHLICHGRSKVTLGWVCIILYSCPSPLSSALWGLDEAPLQPKQSCHFPQQSYSRLKSQLFYWSGPSVMSFISEGSVYQSKIDRNTHSHDGAHKHTIYFLIRYRSWDALIIMPLSHRDTCNFNIVCIKKLLYCQSLLIFWLFHFFFYLSAVKQ